MMEEVESRCKESERRPVHLAIPPLRPYMDDEVIDQRGALFKRVRQPPVPLWEDIRRRTSTSLLVALVSLVSVLALYWLAQFKQKRKLRHAWLYVFSACQLRLLPFIDSRLSVESTVAVLAFPTLIEGLGGLHINMQRLGAKNERGRSVSPRTKGSASPFGAGGRLPPALAVLAPEVCRSNLYLHPGSVLMTPVLGQGLA
jgi:hypothetical protein